MQGFFSREMEPFPRRLLRFFGISSNNVGSRLLSSISGLSRVLEVLEDGLGVGVFLPSGYQYVSGKGLVRRASRGTFKRSLPQPAFPTCSVPRVASCSSEPRLNLRHSSFQNLVASGSLSVQTGLVRPHLACYCWARAARARVASGDVGFKVTALSRPRRASSWFPSFHSAIPNRY